MTTPTPSPYLPGQYAFLKIGGTNSSGANSGGNAFKFKDLKITAETKLSDVTVNTDAGAETFIPVAYSIKGTVTIFYDPTDSHFQGLSGTVLTAAQVGYNTASAPGASTAYGYAFNAYFNSIGAAYPAADAIAIDLGFQSSGAIFTGTLT